MNDFDNLHLIGLGGAVPGYLLNSTDKQWEGFPYKDDKELDT